MPTRTYKGKHAKPPAYAGSTPRGPQRWARAAHNALTRPNSMAGKLFYERVTNAHKMRAKYPRIEGPFGHYDNERLGWDYATRATVFGGRTKRKYVTCSLFCATMVVQLDHGMAGDFDRLERFLTDSEQAPSYIHPRELKRAASCQFCGTKVGG